MNKKIKRYLSTLFTILILTTALILGGLRLLGFRPYAIASSSMSPAYNIGDLIYTKSVELSDLKKGDTVAYIVNDDLLVVTHRVINIDLDNSLIYTKGDNNNAQDFKPINYESIVGKVEFKIPLLGYASSFFLTRNGKLVFIITIIVLSLLFVMPSRKEIRRNEK